MPFERSDLGLGGRSLFVGERGWMESLQELAGVSHDLGRDAGVLEALDELPSLDPFLLREHMKRRGFEISRHPLRDFPGRPGKDAAVRRRARSAG